MFDHDAERGLSGDCRLEVITGDYKVDRDYTDNVEKFQAEVNEFLEEHTVVDYDIHIESYARTGRTGNRFDDSVIHQAWFLYEVDEE